MPAHCCCKVLVRCWICFRPLFASVGSSGDVRPSKIYPTWNQQDKSTNWDLGGSPWGDCHTCHESTMSQLWADHEPGGNTQLRQRSIYALHDNDLQGQILVDAPAHIYTRTNTHTHTHAHTHIHTYAQFDTHTPTATNRHTQTYTCTNTRTHTHTQAQAHAYTSTHRHTHVQTQARTHTQRMENWSRLHFAQEKAKVWDSNMTLLTVKRMDTLSPLNFAREKQWFETPT